MKQLLLAVVVICMLSSIALAEDQQVVREEPAVIVKILDLVIVRPISAGVATVSTAFCAAVSPFTLVAGVPEASVRVLVQAPWRFTGARPLGDFSGRYKDGEPITVVHDQ